MSERPPVFVYGALRSGTTVFRIMLNAHPELANPGEVDFLFDHLHCGADGRWVYDLETLGLQRTFQSAGLVIPERPSEDGRDLLLDFISQYHARADGHLTLNIHRHIDKMADLLPGARIIHLLRDPRDVAQSYIGMGWAGEVYIGVSGWIETEELWDRSAPRFADDQVLEVRYEHLISETEAQLRRVCGFLGVGYEPAMLDYHQGTTYGPPDPSLIEQWRRRMSPRNLGLVEGKLGPLLAARGYAPSGVTPDRPGRLRHLIYRIRNRLGIWRNNVRRYGITLLVMEKLTRDLGLRRLYQKVLEKKARKTLDILK